MQQIINGLAVYTLGSKKNQPIIFIHGFPFDHWMWHNQINKLQKNYYCVAYDARGLGDSYVGDGQYTMEAYVYDLFAIMNHLKLDRPVLCGLSMGGYITLRAAELDQTKFKGLILCDTRTDADDDAGKLVRASKINQINTDGLDAFVEDFVTSLFSDQTIKDKPKMFKEVIERCKQSNPIGVKGALIAIMSRTNTSPFLEKINLPALLIAGSFDKLTPPALMRNMSEKIKDAEFGITPHAGHISPLENPGFVNDLISGFLKRKIK